MQTKSALSKSKPHENSVVVGTPWANYGQPQQYPAYFELANLQ